MKENLEFKNLKEMYTDMPSNKRPNDILIDGKSIFEQHKTPAQTEIIKTGYKLVCDHLRKLNIEQKPFDENRVAFLPQKLSMNAGEYHDGDFFALDESSEANLGTIVHELTHAQSAEWRNYNEEEVEKFLEENNKSVKSGFHRHTNFKTINEGITEKIAREIINNNQTEYDRLKPLFKGRMEEVIQKEEKRFKEEILPNKIKQRDDEITKRNKTIEDFKKLRLEQVTEIDQEIGKAETEREKQLLIQIKKNHEDSIQRYTDDMINLPSGFDAVEYAKKMYSLRIQGIKNDYNFTPQGMNSYDFNVELVTCLVEGISKYNIKSDAGLNKEEEIKKVWIDLQKAYFLGKTVYLRKIDEVFGQGTLRQIDNLSQLTSKKESDEFIIEIKNKVENI